MDDFPRNPSNAEVKRYTTLRKYLDRLIRVVVSENIKASGYPVKEGAIGTLEDSILTIVDEKVLGGFGLLRYVMNNDPAKDADAPLDGNQLKEIMRIAKEAVAKYIAIDKKFQLDKTNKLSKIGNKVQNMAHYWWGQHHQVLFCKTSDGLLLHVPQEHLVRAIREEKSVILKKWLTIQAGKKRKKPMGKGKEKDLEAPKESDILVLPEPKRQRINPQEEEEEEEEEEESSSGLPKLPLEIILMILEQSSEPIPTIRRIIFDVVKPGEKISVFSKALAKPELVWRWYAEVFGGREPPKHLAGMWEYYVKQQEDPNAFVRKWYAGFVREYDLRKIQYIYYKVGINKHHTREHEPREAIKEIMIHLMIETLRSRTFGGGKVDHHVVRDYQSAELSIARARTQLEFVDSAQPLDQLIDEALTSAMLLYATRTQWYDADIKDYENQHTSFTPFKTTKTYKWFVEYLTPILNASKQVIRIIRGLGPRVALSNRDYVSLFWLIMFTLNILKGQSFGGYIDHTWNKLFLKHFLYKLKKEVFATVEIKTQASTHTYAKEEKFQKLKMDHTKNAWVLAGGRRGLNSIEMMKEAAYGKEDMSVLSANIDLVPGNDKIPFNVWNSVITYISNVLGYDETEEELPPILEIIKAFVRDGLKNNYSKDTIKEKIIHIINRFMKGDNWDNLDSNDLAKVRKDVSAKIDLVLFTLAGKAKVVVEEEEEEEEEDYDEREYQKEQAARDRDYTRLRRKDKKKKEEEMSSSKTITVRMASRFWN